MYDLNRIKNIVFKLKDLDDTEANDIKIRTILDEILAYTYRDNIPCEMELAVANVVVSELNKQEIGFDGDVTSYKEGDMSINFGSQTSNGIKYNGKLEGFKLIRGVR